jgi:hypothetical protein
MTPILQANTHVHLSTGQSDLVACFVPDGMDAWYERSNTLRGAATDAGTRTLELVPVNDKLVFTGTLGLAFCNPLSDGIRALSTREAADGDNLHQPGIYTRRLVINSSKDI